MRLVSYLALTVATGSIVVALSACTFVSDKERQDKIASLDDDGDGTPASEDCDDEDPLRHPAGGDPEWKEIPYDGIDNDCDGEDVVDVDGDGFPGVDFEAYAAMQMERFGLASVDDVIWPTSVDRLQKDCVDGDIGIDLNGFEPVGINPAVLNDVPYDGVDQDCAGDNDFDDDGDGQMPATINGTSTAELLDAYITAWNITGIDPTDPNAFGDCDDNKEAVFTGAPNEVAYDGIDQDCSGDNDFDQDGDGYYPTEYASDFATFVQNFHADTAPDGPPSWAAADQTRAESGDCLDQPHPALPAADPALIYPGAEDTPYDGLDSNCLGDNDFDQDGDTYIRTEDTLNFQDYVTNWSGGPDGYPNTVDPLTEADAGDCDDTNATIAPGNLEILGDANDADCDLLPDATPFGFGGYAWDTPSWPRLARTNQHYVLGTTGAWTSLSDRQNPALALLFEAENTGYDSEEDDVVVWNNISPVQTFVHGSGFDLIAEGDSFWVAATYKAPDLNAPENDRARILIRQHTYDGVSGYQYELANRVFNWQGYDVDLDLQLDDQNQIWIVACGGGGREDPNGPPEDPVSPAKPTSFRAFNIGAPVFTDVALQNVGLLAQNSTTNSSTACFQEVAPDGNSALITVCDTAGCESFDADISASPGTVAASADTTWLTSQFNEADDHDGLLILADATDGATIVDSLNAATYTMLSGETVLSIDAMWRNNVLYVAAIVADSPTNRVVLMYGNDPATGLDTTLDLPVYDYDSQYTHVEQGGCDPLVPGCSYGRNLDPYKISLQADAERLAIAVSAMSLDDPIAPTDSLAIPLAQDAVGWLFMGYDSTALP